MNRYVGLLDESGAEAEGFSRQPVRFRPASGRHISNEEAIIFAPQKGRPWGRIDGFAIYDEAGEQLLTGKLNVVHLVEERDTLEFDVGALQINFDMEEAVEEFLPSMTSCVSWWPGSKTAEERHAERDALAELPPLEPLVLEERSGVKCPICGRYVARGEFCVHGGEL